MSFSVQDRVWSRCLAALLARRGGLCASDGRRRLDRCHRADPAGHQSLHGLTTQKGVVLTRAGSPVAGIAEVHERSMDEGIMRMRAVDRVPWKAGQTIALKSGGLHIMMDLKKQIKAGERVPLKLSFKAADGTVSTVEANATAGFSPPT